MVLLATLLAGDEAFAVMVLRELDRRADRGALYLFGTKRVDRIHRGCSPRWKE